MHALSPGTVALVGAGPGDPGLITLRGSQLLAQADVVIYDALSSPKLLRHAPNAEHFYVGKLAARHSMSQENINALLVEQAKLNKRVVRLKGGDPFVFGRGGEECEAMLAAGVPYVIVPGITAAIAAPAYAGIPVTHRDFNSSFTLITGHEKEEAYRDDEAKARDKATGSSDVDWAALAKLPCVAFYMGVKALPRISANLIANGLSPDTPAATIQWGTTPKQRTVTATIATIVDAVKAAGVSSPAITIVGRVVSMRSSLDWFEQRPLFGQTIVVTRTRDQASDLSDRLEALGANVLEAPTIELTPIASHRLHAVLNGLAYLQNEMPKDLVSTETVLDLRLDWLVLTSANGVRALRERMQEMKLDARIFGFTKVAAIGSATAQAIRDCLCIEPDCVPEQAVSEALADELIKRHDISGKNVLVVRAEIGRPVLIDRLQAAGASVDDAALYSTNIATALPADVVDAVAANKVDWVTFTSSSTAKNFVALLGDNYQQQLANVKTASIGPVTSDAIKALGLPVTVQAETAGVGALVDAVLSYSK